MIISFSSWEDGLRLVPTPERTEPVQGVPHNVRYLLLCVLFACCRLNRYDTVWIVSRKAPVKTG